MPRRPTRSRRLATAAAWPGGIGLTAWHYMWRITPLHRRELAGTMPADAAPPLPPATMMDEVQGVDAGVGPLFHRRYQARIAGPELSAEELFDRIAADPNRVAPTEFARFSKVRGTKGGMAVGDEYVVRMPGPWDGPVRVVEVTPTSFRLATLDGHLEAGQIQFRAEGDGADIVFTVESWARSGDRFSLIMYQRLHMAKEVQLHMWTSFLERVVELAGGRLAGGIDIETRSVSIDTETRSVSIDNETRSVSIDTETRAVVDERQGPAPLGDPGARRILDDLHGRSLNFDPGEGGFRGGDGWLSDDYRQPLAPEEPGPPVPGGSWEVAQRLMRDYQFADPAIVRAVYYPDRPLEDRDMLLEARFYGLRFRFGVRVGGVLDETREVEGREVRVWGWNYRTLQGHLEMGQMDYEVWKWLDSGEVEFHTCRFSRRAKVGNPVVRVGLRLFGRHQQVRFARRACERMAALTAAALSHGDLASAPE